MRSKTFLSISLLSIAALTSACSRHKVAAAPTPTGPTSADRENAKLHMDAGDASDKDAANRSGPRAGDRDAISSPVYFQFDRSEITDDGIQSLDQKVDVLQRNPNVRIRIEGNADDSGSDEYNLEL